MASLHILFTVLCQAYWQDVSIRFGFQLALKEKFSSLKISVCRRRQLASHWYLLQITCSQVVLKWSRDGNLWVWDQCCREGDAYLQSCSTVHSLKSSCQCRDWHYWLKWWCLGTATQAFCEKWPATTCQVYHSNIQQLQCHHIQGNLEDAHLYGPKEADIMIFLTDGVGLKFPRRWWVFLHHGYFFGFRCHMVDSFHAL